MAVVGQCNGALITAPCENKALFHNYLLTSVQYLVLRKVCCKNGSFLLVTKDKIWSAITITNLEFEIVCNC